jgi:hypothetical protein
MHADSLKTVSDLIDAFGGSSAFAKVLRKGQSTASEMRRSGRIVDEHWDRIIAAARAVGIVGLEYRHFVQMNAIGRRGAGAAAGVRR